MTISSRRPSMPNAFRQLRRRIPLCFVVLGWLLFCSVPPARAAAAPDGHGVAEREVSFGKDIKPLLEASCIQCHAKGKTKGGLSLETREALLKGGDTGPAALPGKGKDSLIVKLVSSTDPDEVMPKKGTKWTPDQIALLRAWIDKGMRWDDGVTFAKPQPVNLKPRQVALPDGPEPHPVDRLVSAYFKSPAAAAAAAHAVPSPSTNVVDDRLFARRAWLDAVGLLPPPAELEAFVADRDPDKRAKLVAKLLADPYGYADHWLTFWNDLLRNDYKGTGFIDGGRSQVTGWLYSALLSNKPYDRFVRELVAPAADSEGFVKGIVWRGTVPASMSVPVQAAQNVSQVFLGVNLKCAGCHDSFVSDWTLADAYGLAAVFSDKPLELVHCDRPTGKTAAAQFLYPEIGGIDPALGRDERLKRFSELLTSSANGRLSRNVVNRLWSRLMGRGLVEPLDDMEKPAWSPDLLDWLAEDLAAHRYDLKRTIGLIMTSRAYQMPVVEPVPETVAGSGGGGGGSGNVSASASTTASGYVFRGPHARRLSAEQFADAVSTLTGDWGDFPASVELDYTARGALNQPSRLPAWVWTDEPVTAGVRRSAWQVARAKGEAAQKAAADAQKLIDADAPNGAAAAAEASTKAKAAADEAARFAALADAVVRSPERAAQIASGTGTLDAAAVQLVRHKVVFRKRFALDAVPERALAAVVASQRVEVFVNNRPLVTVSNDRERAMLGDRRSAFADLKPLLQKGENVVVLAVDSHTERPDLKNEDRDRLPNVFNHLNERSGVAFFATLTAADGKAAEWATDNTWTARRSPEAGSQRADFADKGWPVATTLPAGTAPEDVGPILTDAGVRPAGKPGTDFAVRLPGLVALTARPPGTVRASLRTADPLQLALGRPNREMVTSVRQDAATTIQAMELTNGGTLDAALKKSAAKLVAAAAKDPAGWVDGTYRKLLSRPPSDGERAFAGEALGEKPTPEAVADLVWALAMQPEFQYVH